MALNKNIGINSVENMVLFLALILYLTAAIYNSGYYHPDEHFQILEFAKWKLGQSSGTSMAWEHEAMIRPTLEPWIRKSFPTGDGNSDTYGIDYALFLTLVL